MAYTTIDDPSKYFHVRLYSGTGSSQAITNNANAGDFQPDWIWAKNRSDSAGHISYDSSRGVNKNLTINVTDAEATVTTQVTAFGSNGFTVGSNNGANGSSDNLVAFQWKANGGTTTTNDASATSVGTIDSVYQANTTAGFSIVTYDGNGSSGASFAHGLGVVPDFIIIKNRSEAKDWAVYHGANTSAPQTDALFLNLTDATIDNTGYWNDTAPTSSIITVGDNTKVNSSGEQHVAYCFTEKQGYSKFGLYEGNANADGPFIYTGFKPAFIILKRNNAVADWEMNDNKRNGYNGGNVGLTPNTNSAEATANELDLLSNGFKIRTTNDNWNPASGQTLIYIAFAESPFVSSKGVPTTAR
jgi:hypothetical protein